MSWKRVLLLDNVTLTANELKLTASMWVRGASQVFFHISATDASNQLQANTIIRASNDGSTFVSTSTANPSNGYVSCTATGVNSTALHTGGVIMPLKLCDIGGGESTTPCCRAQKALVALQAPAGGIAGMTVYGWAFYDDGNFGLATTRDDLGLTA